MNIIVSNTEKSSEDVKESSNGKEGFNNRKGFCSGKTQSVINNPNSKNLKGNNENKSPISARQKRPTFPASHERKVNSIHSHKYQCAKKLGKNAKKPLSHNKSRSSKNSIEEQKELTSEYLEKILQEDPYKIPLIIDKISVLYNKLLNNTSTLKSVIGLILKLLEKAFASQVNTEKAFDLFLITFKNSNFKYVLMSFISEIKYNTDKTEEYLTTVATIIEQVLKVSPINGYPLVSSIFDMCYGIMNNIKYENQPSLDNLKQKFEEIKFHINEGHKKLKSFQEEQACKNAPPDDFRQHEIIPTCDELNAKRRPYLRPNIVKGGYDDTEHYLDVQFRLLKEDFIRPLREGLQQYLNTKSTKNLDIKVYTNVYLSSTGIEKGEFVHHLKLNLRKKFNVENSKRLMFGNILLISSDNFKSMTIATIFSRDHLKNSIVTVKIESKTAKLEKDKIFMAIESNSYFVAYKHTLKALQEIAELPLKQYFVEVNETNSPPAYLSKLSKYRIGLREFCVLDSIDNWPSSNYMKLDESQRRALHGALTREMAIIQGPPGTGKTFLGLLITKILLSNTNIVKNTLISHRLLRYRLKDTRNKDTILVVCYTNHALDQFLEGMLSFTESICRVGSRSQNEKLTPYQINNLLYHRNGKPPRCSEHISKQYHYTRMKIKELTDKIEDITNIIDVINYEPGILSIKSFEVFSPIIPPYFKQLIFNNSFTFFLMGNYNHIPYYYADNFYPAKSKTFGTEMWDEDDELDEQIRRLEEYHRILDDGGHVDSNYGKNLFVGSKRLTFEINLKKLEDCMKKSKSKNEKLYLENLLRDVENALQVGQNIPFTMKECRALQNRFLHNLSFADRFKLYNFWKFQLVQNYQKKLPELEKEICQLNKSLLSQKDLVYLDIMKNVHVVGMTTTAAAQYNNILHDLAPPIVIVEEAAEIMEAHLVTSLSSKCKHLILIGDHQQLKPKPNVYELEVKYNMDKSFFERMVNNGIVYHTLEYQHRMRPSISNLLVPTIYKNLKDHESVFSHPDVKGMKKNLFFIDHNVYESPPVQEFQSYENPHEAKFLLGLCRHFLYQDYTNDDITILTPYLGQFRLFKKLQKESEFYKCRGVRICVLDNYQGEESNIILLSLVRSNEEKKVGFMKIDNRVNVALSRAKHGMFIIGNMSQMAEASELWKEINKKLIDGSNIGPELHLDCYSHPSTVITIKSYEEFLQKSPKGGCKLPCTVALPECGHNCPMQYCHGFDREHLHFRCVEPCLKTCELGHHCPEKCFEECPPCQVLVDKVLPCGHTRNMLCSIPPDDYNCPTIVEKILPVCKHSVNVACYKNINDIKCKEPCTIRLDCGHKCNLNCHPTDDPNHEKYRCQAPCEKIPENCEFDHKCSKPCSSSCGTCETLIDRQLKCGHVLKNVKCRVPENIIKCGSKCERILDCGHICPKLCYQKCGDCIEKVSKVVPGCKHTAEVPCSVLPSEKFCFGNCVKKLPCGHQCCMKCHEKCSSKCMHSVESRINCPKNHPLKMPCYINESLDKLSTNPQDVGEYCDEKCGETLKCGHLCKGKCGECLNGRVHLVCEEKCSKTLICGHVCTHACSSCCSSCEKLISWNCPHQRVKLVCGRRFRSCKKLCTRGCVHSACKAKCGEPCSFNPCTESCPEKLKCGHACIGYCGDKCPNLCFVCDKDEVETLTKSKNDSNTRFVILEDCGHVFEGVWMDNWMNSSTNEGKSEIGMKTCPKCHVLIINTQRYWNATHKNYESILDAYSNFHQYSLKFKKQDLVASLIVLQHKFRDEVCKIGAELNFNQNFQETRGTKYLSVEKYILYEYQLDFLRKTIRPKTIDQYNESSLKKLIATLMKCSKLSPQASFEFSCELRRLDISTVLQRTQKRVDASKNVSDVFKLDKINCLSREIEQLMRPQKFDESAEDKIKVLIKEIESEIGMYEFIYPYERREILKTANLNQGNWYKCPKGHACFSDEHENLPNCLNCKAVGPTLGQNKNKNKKYQKPKTFNHQGNVSMCLQGHYYYRFNEESKCLYCVGLTAGQNGNQNKKQNFHNKNNRKTYPKRK